MLAAKELPQLLLVNSEVYIFCNLSLPVNNHSVYMLVGECIYTLRGCV